MKLTTIQRQSLISALRVKSIYGDFNQSINHDVDEDSDEFLDLFTKAENAAVKFREMLENGSELADFSDMPLSQVVFTEALREAMNQSADPDTTASLQSLESIVDEFVE